MNYYATRGNKVLKINEDAISRYLGQGYTIKDESGKLVQKGTPHDTNLLTAEFKAQIAENENLKNEILRLKGELDRAKAEIADLKKELANANTVSAEPKTTTRRRKQTITESEE